MGFRKILVAIDKTPLGSVVFEQALELAKTQGASLKIFHCLRSEDLGQVSSLIEVGAGTYLPSYPIGEKQRAQLQQTLEQTEAWLRNYCQKAMDEGISTEFEYRLEEAGSSICDAAHTWEADLIVLGRRGRQGLAEALLGSVSNYVVHHAACSVLVIQQ